MRSIAKKAGGLARRAGALLLAAAVAAGALAAAPRPALAEAGSLTVRPATESGASYRAYCVFLADVSDDGRATGIEWPGAEVKSAVMGYVRGEGYDSYLSYRGHTREGEDEVAEVAAAYCASKITNSERAAGSKTPAAASSRAAGSFAAGLARALASSGAPFVAVEAGAATAMPQGLYLVLSDDSTVGDGFASTSPVWTAVGTSTEVREKVAVPTVKVEARAPGDAGFAPAADALAGQEVEYRVTATLPTEAMAYPSYFLQLDVSLEKAGKFVDRSVSVDVDGEDVKDRLVAREGGFLTASTTGVSMRLSDALEMPGAGAGSVVTLTFRATKEDAPNAAGHANKSAYGECRAKLTYSSDPSAASQHRSMEASARLYSHTAAVTITDTALGRVVVRTVYSLRVAECADASLVGKYVASDGTLSDSVAWQYNENGDHVIRFRGLAAGTYVLHQIEAPSGYPAQDSDITLKVEPSYDALGGVGELKATVAGGYSASSFGSGGTRVASVDADACEVLVDSSVEKVMKMPLTGLVPDGAAGCAAAALGAAGAVAVVLALARRRRDARAERGLS